MRTERPTPISVPNHLRTRVRFSLLYLALLLAFVAGGIGLYRGGIHLVELEAGSITLGELPGALTLSLFRILAAYGFALVFSLFVGIIAAKSRWGERLIVPSLDILQSIPIVGFFPAAIMFFIGITNGHRIGVEFAAVFLIFTSQAWNMAFAVYESVKSIPQDNLDAIDGYGIRGFDRVTKLYLPVCVPRLIYNSILSMANGWFFLVACEIIAQGPVRYHLPGIGSFLSRAAENDQIELVLWGLAALTTLIFAMDLFVWRPLSVWSERFKNESSSSGEIAQKETLAEKIYDLLYPLFSPGKQVFSAIAYPMTWIFREVLLPLFWLLPLWLMKSVFDFAFQTKQRQHRRAKSKRWETIQNIIGWGFVGLVGTVSLYYVVLWLRPPWPDLVNQIPAALMISTGRLLVAMAITLAWVLPLVLWTWNRPSSRQALSTVAQIGASLPAIALFPLFILVVAEKLGGGMELASLLLLLTGMQWYLLFNCLGGTATIPHDLVEATKALGLKTTQTWKKLVFPAMRPALITGALTAWGGGWNALVIAEYVTFKDEVLQVNGIGSLLNQAVYEIGDNRAIMLCLAAMVGWILLLNVVFWQPMYRLATTRFRMDT